VHQLRPERLGLGDNYFGELGDGTITDKNMLTQIGTDTKWISVSAGTWHTVAVKSDGTLWAWWSNYNGQLGDGTTTDKNTPTQIFITPIADFFADLLSGAAPLDVSFIDMSSNTPTSWYWTFGDGGTSTEQDPSYTYGEAGTYTVTLTATNPAGSDMMTKTGYITVSCPTQPLKISGTPSEYGSSLQEVYDNHADTGDIIKIHAGSLTESPNLNRDIDVTLKGGYDACYATNAGTSTIVGTLTIASGTVTVEKIEIR
jgi:PKD repeat protein